MKVKKIQLGFGIAAIILASAAYANVYLESVVQQLNKAHANLVKAGFRKTGEEISALRAGSEVKLDLTAKKGQMIGVVGVCDQDCNDLDLGLVSPSGDVLSIDTKDNAMPVIGIDSAPVTGTYGLFVGMSGCRTEECVYGVAAYTK